MPQKKKRTTQRKTRKPKVYIPAYKAIILCCTIITICMSLLLITSLKDQHDKVSDSVIERYKEEIVDPKKSEAEKKAEPEKKADTGKKTEASKKTEKPAEPPKKSEKIETPQSKEEAKKVRKSGSKERGCS